MISVGALSEAAASGFEDAAPSVLALDAIPGAEVFGALALTQLSTLLPVGIAGSEAFGSAVIDGGVAHHRASPDRTFRTPAQPRRWSAPHQSRIFRTPP